MRNNIFYILLLAVAMVSCSSHKTVVQDTAATTTTKSAGSSAATSFVTKVINNNVNTDNIVGSASVTLKFGDKDITVPGSVHMRKDQVIRIQLFIPLLGTEIGRLEFTPSYVLVMDRMNKQYVKGDYNQLDFLRANGISFYSLQALFWNQLIIPGKQKITTADASAFTADMTGGSTQIPLSLNSGQIQYKWNASKTDNKLTSALITYNSKTSGASMLTWLYSNFTNVSGKKFPATQEFSFQTVFDGKNQQGDIKINMSEVKTSSDWETETTISSKYKKVEAQDVLSKLMSL